MLSTVTLTLKPHAAFNEEQSKSAELNRLLTETKKLICNSCKVQNVKSLRDLISSTATPEQCDFYAKISQGDIDQDKATISENLKELVQNDILESENEIIKMISKDIKELHKIRATRKKELEKLQNTQSRLVKKAAYYEDQSNYYERYIADCLAKQTAVKEGKRKNSISGSFRRNKDSKNVVKYSAEELRKKGVLIQIENEEIKNFKRVQVKLPVYRKIIQKSQLRQIYIKN